MILSLDRGGSGLPISPHPDIIAGFDAGDVNDLTKVDLISPMAAIRPAGN